MTTVASTARRRLARYAAKPWSLLCLAFAWCGAAQAQVAHVEDPDVVTRTFLFLGSPVLCVRNDGVVAASVNDCLGVEDPANDGALALIAGHWGSRSIAGINACGSGAADPVAAAECPIAEAGTDFANCVAHGWVMVQTAKSGRYFAAQGDGECDRIESVQPCRKNDSFNPTTGCMPSANPPELTIESGYLKPSGTLGVPPATDCDEGIEIGRMQVDAISERIYFCAQDGWRFTAMGAPP